MPAALNVSQRPGLTHGNCGRDTLFEPGRTNFDQSLFKNFRFREKLTIEFRAEAFNIFNRKAQGHDRLLDSRREGKSDVARTKFI
jgi:hypothetical protein